MNLNKVKNFVINLVYWSSLVGPVYSLVVGTVKGFVSAIQNIREEEKRRIDYDKLMNPDISFIDLSDSPEAKVMDVIINNNINMKG